MDEELAASPGKKHYRPATRGGRNPGICPRTKAIASCKQDPSALIPAEANQDLRHRLPVIAAIAGQALDHVQAGLAAGELLVKVTRILQGEVQARKRLDADGHVESSRVPSLVLHASAVMEGDAEDRLAELEGRGSDHEVDILPLGAEGSDVDERDVAEESHVCKGPRHRAEEREREKYDKTSDQIWLAFHLLPREEHHVLILRPASLPQSASLHRRRAINYSLTPVRKIPSVQEVDRIRVGGSLTGRTRINKNPIDRLPIAMLKLAIPFLLSLNRSMAWLSCSGDEIKTK
eukprot:752535-Hanusia_phi.AAC.4